MLKLTDKLDLRRGQKSVALSNLSIYYTWENVKSSYDNNRFKISAPTWSEEFKLRDGSNSISDIQDYFEYILKKHSENVENPSIRIYVNKIENRITFKIKSGPVHCNLVNNDYQQDSRILYTFVPNKTFGSLLEISPTNHIFLKTFNSESQEIKIWFTDQTSKPLEVEDRINVTLIIKQCRLNATPIECNSVKCNFHRINMRYSIKTRERRHVKGYGFLSFARNIGKHATKVAKNMRNKYGQKLADKAKKSATDAIKTASKRAIQKTADQTGDLVGN